MAGAEDDDKVEPAVIPDKEEREDAPKSLRESIKAAVKEHSEDEPGAKADSTADVSERRDTVRSKRAKSDNNSVEDSVSDTKDNAQDDRPAKEPKEAKEESTAPEKSAEEKIDPPPFFKNKGKATWDKLSAEDKRTIIARETEVSNGFAQVSQRLKATEEIERAIAPRMQAIQGYGASPAQVVDRLFQWMEGLNDPTRRIHTLKQLAHNFGVDVSQLASGVPQQEVQPDPNAPPAWFNEFTTTVDKKVQTLEQQLQSQKDAAIESQILSWAKDKPHYNQVSQLMGQLMASGAVPALNEHGAVNLDGAYDAAIKLNPQVAALIQQEKDAKIAEEATQKALKEAKEKADRLAKAKRAGTGLKPAAPSFPTPLNGKGPKEDSSIRGSIRKAIEDLRS